MLLCLSQEDLASLLSAINAADPHFVRCINPNSKKQVDLFTDQKAIEQLRYVTKYYIPNPIVPSI